METVSLTETCRRKGFRGGPLLDFQGSSMQLLDSSHVRDRDKALLARSSPQRSPPNMTGMCGGVWRKS